MIICRGTNDTNGQLFTSLFRDKLSLQGARIAFDNVKSTITKEVVLAYPDFTKPFEIYTNASTKQLGAVITQENRPIAFFSRKLSGAQSKYTVTKLELLAIVETLKEFNGMLWDNGSMSTPTIRISHKTI
jgi:hypothetical protein